MTRTEKYRERGRRLATRTTKPTLTDQSQAHDTSIKVIVARFLPGTAVPGAPKRPIYGADMTGVPRDLAEMIAQLRSIEKLHADLPEQFRELSVQDLLELTPQAIADRIQPPAITPAKEEEKK
ncbi:MAG: internal scaffolding protein [Microvirus sp.]|nr:MAG: internal scaffolding protein [Microvirus sp.]